MWQTLEQLRELREGLQAQAPEWAGAVVSRILHTLKLKMAWVEEQPALLWQAGDPAKAAELLGQHDAFGQTGA